MTSDDFQRSVRIRTITAGDQHLQVKNLPAFIALYRAKLPINILKTKFYLTMMFLILGIDYLLELQDPEISAKTEADGNVLGNNSCRKYE